MKITVEIDVGPDLSMHKHINMLEHVWRECPFSFDGLKVIEPCYGGVTEEEGFVIERPVKNPYSLSARAEQVKKKINNLQYDINKYSYNIDLESMLIAIEGHVDTLKRYEELNEQSRQKSNSEES